jgi:alcohol dehydrogenase class IV
LQDIFTFYLPTRIIHGANSVSQTGPALTNLGVTKALILTDKGVNAAGLLEPVYESLKTSNIPYAVFDDVEEDPDGVTVGKGADFAKKENCDGIVVVGGGSLLCAGRGIGVLVTNGGKIQDYAGVNKASKPPLPLIGIPTTTGWGAEVSQFIVFKNEEKHAKMVVGSPMYFSEVVILDPMLIRTLPYGQMAASDDLDAKEACLIGSSMANMACGNARLGLVHSMSTAMEGEFKGSHGLAIGILLPNVMAFNMPASYERFAALAGGMGESAVDFPDRFSESQLDRKAIPYYAKRVVAGLYGVFDPDQEKEMNAPVPSANIRKATMKDAIDIYEKCFEGWDGD